MDISLGRREEPEHYSEESLDQSEETRKQPVGPATINKIFCVVCGQQFSRAEHYERHYLRHTGLKPYTCGICYMGFSRRDLLQRHQGHVHALNRDNPDGQQPSSDTIARSAGRNPIACTNCANSKTKCDRGDPCKRCLTRNLKCEHRDKRRRDTGTKSQAKEKAASQSPPDSGNGDNGAQSTPDSCGSAMISQAQSPQEPAELQGHQQLPYFQPDGAATQLNWHSPLSQTSSPPGRHRRSRNHSIQDPHLGGQQQPTSSQPQPSPFPYDQPMSQYGQQTSPSIKQHRALPPSDGQERAPSLPSHPPLKSTNRPISQYDQAPKASHDQHVPNQVSTVPRSFTSLPDGIGPSLAGSQIPAQGLGNGIVPLESGPQQERALPIRTAHGSVSENPLSSHGTMGSTDGYAFPDLPSEYLAARGIRPEDISPALNVTGFTPMDPEFSYTPSTDLSYMANWGFNTGTYEEVYNNFPMDPSTGLPIDPMLLDTPKSDRATAQPPCQIQEPPVFAGAYSAHSTRQIGNSAGFVNQPKRQPSEDVRARKRRNISEGSATDFSTSSGTGTDRSFSPPQPKDSSVLPMNDLSPQTSLGSAITGTDGYFSSEQIGGSLTTNSNSMSRHPSTSGSDEGEQSFSFPVPGGTVVYSCYFIPSGDGAPNGGQGIAQIEPPAQRQCNHAKCPAAGCRKVSRF
ncbi:hypothetical protein GQ43DRAFT_204711 [Delitschia confertaspora ATCC 74209]|uniref:Zn(2)-C6 fungal-type domain-containing protein n=1 Tax=Delitschia confertaspora ATCC 74209 TaxID=1513339 RepID=A0A9P4MSF7_9PLEO|nr:hypothetical protein GQ43DRAFT_204711 [Delitschia confertaspora ATCC 74209]